MTEAPSIETLRDIAERVVARKGEDYVDQFAKTGENCLYWYDGGPSCIVGHILTEVGVEDDILIEYDADIATDMCGRLGWGNDSEQARYLRAMQRKQDKGFTWGEALEFGDYLLAHPECYFDLIDGEL